MGHLCTDGNENPLRVSVRLSLRATGVEQALQKWLLSDAERACRQLVHDRVTESWMLARIAGRHPCVNGIVGSWRVSKRVARRSALQLISAQAELRTRSRRAQATS